MSWCGESWNESLNETYPMNNIPQSQPCGCDLGCKPTPHFCSRQHQYDYEEELVKCEFVMQDRLLIARVLLKREPNVTEVLNILSVTSTGGGFIIEVS